MSEERKSTPAAQVALSTSIVSICIIRFCCTTCPAGELRILVCVLYLSSQEVSPERQMTMASGIKARAITTKMGQLLYNCMYRAGCTILLHMVAFRAWPGAQRY